MRAILLVMLLTVLYGCGERIERFSGPTMGSTYSIQYVPTAQTPDPLVWDLSTVYASDAAWEAARKAAVDELPQLAALKGSLGKNAASLRVGLAMVIALCIAGALLSTTTRR